jgi:hypothetical protein
LRPLHVPRLFWVVRLTSRDLNVVLPQKKPAAKQLTKPRRGYSRRSGTRPAYGGERFAVTTELLLAGGKATPIGRGFQREVIRHVVEVRNQNRMGAYPVYRDPRSAVHLLVLSQAALGLVSGAVHTTDVNRSSRCGRDGQMEIGSWDVSAWVLLSSSEVAASTPARRDAVSTMP